ncbi:MAG TPA: protein-disulfide reductase DsbD domain-containing protein [Stellaceae bacterium]|nr:protein-disulfide reductase DsbD domain-containing protein [Stellaceae bacterium]
MDDKGQARRRLGALALLTLVCLLPGQAAAGDGASDWFVTDQGKARLIAASPVVGDAATLGLGLEFRLAPHWKIYWRSPGDAGYPPRLDWAGSTNLADAALSWPAPQRFSVSGFETVGYVGHVVLPIAARLEQPGQETRLRLALSYLTCSETCIPYDAVLSLDLPAASPAPGGSDYAALIARYAQRVPGDGRDAGLALVAASLVTGRTPMLELRVATQRALLAPDAFIEGPPDISFGVPHLAASDAPGQALLRLPVAGAPAALDRLVGQKLAVTLVDGDRALESGIVPEAAPPPADLGLLLAILPLALLGGFILNFMPCVLPVLSIKLLGVIKHGGGSRAALRRGFLASAAGVILSFLVLAAAMTTLKAAGIAIGWGVQFQQPLFLVFMAVLVTLFACNLWGFFEVPLPSWVGGLALRQGEGGALLGNVAAGAFATLLATPCSAPFLGTAIGFALAAGPLEIFVIFLALGIGLAAPYLLVALLPSLARGLPRPGRWMLVLRRVLGLALAATALWLVSVLADQIGLAPALAVAGLLAVAAAMLGLRPAPHRRGLAAAASLVLAFVVPVLWAAPPAAPAGDAFWHGFDRAAIDRLVGEGQVVFVDVTADWCLTCKVNEKLVIDQPEVRHRLEQPGVTAMRADWTRPSDAIAAYLRSFGRYGIPFNAVYGPGLPHGRALSEILTGDQILRALAEAAGPRKLAVTAR